MPVEPAMNEALGIVVDVGEDAGEDLVRKFVTAVRLDPEAARAEARHGECTQTFRRNAEGNYHLGPSRSGDLAPFSGREQSSHEGNSAQNPLPAVRTSLKCERPFQAD